MQYGEPEQEQYGQPQPNPGDAQQGGSCGKGGEQSAPQGASQDAAMGGQSGQGHMHMQEHLTGVVSDVGMGGAAAGAMPGQPQGQMPGQMPGQMGQPMYGQQTYAPQGGQPQMGPQPYGQPGYGYPQPGMYQQPYMAPGPQPMYGQPYAPQGYPQYGAPQYGPEYGGQQTGGCGDSSGQQADPMGPMMAMMGDMMQGRQPNPQAMMQVLESCSSTFWKGALVGVAATLLLTNDAVKDALGNAFSSLTNEDETAE